jgi:putative zinc finger/helix-turn-helix YgiT family protein
MKCVDCGKGRMVMKRVRVPHEIRGVRFEVEDEARVCSHCGFITIPLARADRHGRLVDETYRRLAGILTAEQIRAARKRLRMNQREFAGYLGVGEASVKRWETGVLPDKSSSDLIQLKTDPEVARRNYETLCSLLGLPRPQKPETITIILEHSRFIPEQRFAWKQPILDRSVARPHVIQ